MESVATSATNLPTLSNCDIEEATYKGERLNALVISAFRPVNR